MGLSHGRLEGMPSAQKRDRLEAWQAHALRCKVPRAMLALFSLCCSRQQAAYNTGPGSLP
jgi:hypothetical protein